MKALRGFLTSAAVAGWSGFEAGSLKVSCSSSFSVTTSPSATDWSFHSNPNKQSLSSLATQAPGMLSLWDVMIGKTVWPWSLTDTYCLNEILRLKLYKYESYTKGQLITGFRGISLLNKMKSTWFSAIRWSFLSQGTLSINFKPVMPPVQLVLCVSDLLHVCEGCAGQAKLLTSPQGLAVNENPGFPLWVEPWPDRTNGRSFSLLVMFICLAGGFWQRNSERKSLLCVEQDAIESWAQGWSFCLSSK